MILAAILHLTFMVSKPVCCFPPPDTLADVYRTIVTAHTKPDKSIIGLRIGGHEYQCWLDGGQCTVHVQVPSGLLGPPSDYDGKRSLNQCYMVSEDCPVNRHAVVDCEGVRPPNTPNVYCESTININKILAGTVACTSEPKYPAIDFTCVATAAGCVAGLPITFTAHPSVFTPWQPLGCETWTWCWSAEEPCDAPVVGTAGGSTVTHTYRYGGSYAPRVSVKSDRGEVKDAIGPTVTVSGPANPMTSTERAVRAQGRSGKAERQ